MDDMPGVGLGVMIMNEDNKLLLILRNSDPKKADSDMRLEGTWTFPSGKVKKGETIIEAAIRKVKEETNLEVKNLKVISIADDINEYAHFVTIGFVTKDYKGDVVLNESKEHVDYKFFGMDELPENLCEPSKKIIKNYINNKIY